MTEQLRKDLEDLPALGQIDAAELADKIIDAVIDVLMNDKTIPKRTGFEWWLALATVRAFTVDEITSQILDHIDRQDALNTVEWKDY